LLESVVLVVYGWKSVEPGPLAWVFPSLAAAVRAAGAMTNAVRWAVLASSAAYATADAGRALSGARAAGSVLVDHAG
jgi:hypothetical protein